MCPLIHAVMLLVKSAGPQKESSTVEQFEFNGVPFTYNEDTNKFLCGLCPNEAVQRNIMRNHIRTVHVKGKS